MSTREMPGHEDLEGKTLNNLEVGRMVARYPVPTYETTCVKCGSSSTARGDKLSSGVARCKFSGCGDPVKTRSPLAEQVKKIAQLEKQRNEAERQASVARMEAETEGYVLPLGFVEAKLAHERQKAEAAEREVAEREASTKRKAVEAAKRERQEKLRSYEAAWILTDHDPKLVVTDEMRSANMPTTKAAAFNEAEANKFIQATAEYAEYRNPDNSEKIMDYFGVNGVGIVDAEMVKAAFVRLRDLGILAKNHKPVVQPPAQRVNLSIAPAETKALPVTFAGWDEDGNPRQYSAREVSKWGSEEMRRRLRLTKEKISLPFFGPGPLGSLGR